MKLSTQGSEGRPTPSFDWRGWFSPTLLCKNITRFWPIWALYAAALFLLLPMELFSAMNRAGSSAPPPQRVLGILEGAINGAPAVGLAFGILVAMALFSYLMNPRACQFLHALPIRREGLFLTNWVTGLLFFLVPGLLIALITLPLGVLCQVNILTLILRWFLVQTVCSMFFFCFGFFCAMFTGSLFALPLFYGILNVLVLGVCFLLDFLLPHLLLGFSGSSLASSTLTRWCTPVYHLFHLVANGKSLTAVCFSIVLGAVFTVAALGVYRLRQLERAGDIVTVGWVRPVFQYGFGVCVGLAGGVFLFERFFYDGSPQLLIALVILCAVVGAFAARMLLKKTFRVLRETWKGVAIMAAALLLLLGGTRADLFGFQRWTPDPSKVKQVTLSSLDSAPWDSGENATLTITDPDAIRQVISIHQGVADAVITDLIDTPAWTELPWWEGEDRDIQAKSVESLRLRYTLTDGTPVVRYYDPVPISAQALADPSSYAAQLQDLLNRPASILNAYFSWWLDEDLTLSDLEAAGGWLSSLAPVDQTPSPAEEIRISANGSEVVDAATGDPLPAAIEQTDSDSGSLTAAQARYLWAAVREDFLAGRIGRRYLLEDRDRRENCYLSDIHLTLAYTIRLSDGRQTTRTNDLTVTPQVTSTSTLKALEELGYLPRLLVHE